MGTAASWRRRGRFLVALVRSRDVARASGGEAGNEGDTLLRGSSKASPPERAAKLRRRLPRPSAKRSRQRRLIGEPELDRDARKRTVGPRQALRREPEAHPIENFAPGRPFLRETAPECTRAQSDSAGNVIFADCAPDRKRVFQRGARARPRARVFVTPETRLEMAR
jgi:hypothetical protein